MNIFNINLDAVKEFQDVLDKHNVKFNYYEKCKKLQEKLDRGKSIDDLNLEFEVFLKDYKALNKIIKNKFFKENIKNDEGIIFLFDNGSIVNCMTFNDNINELIFYDSLYGDDIDIDTAEDLDEALTKVENQARIINACLENKTIKTCLDRISEIEDMKRETLNREDEEIVKLKKQIVKITELQKDFK